MANPTAPAQLTHVSVDRPSKLPAVSCSRCVGAAAASVRLVSAGSARAAAGTAGVVRVSDRRPRCADVEKVVLVLPAAARVAFRGASVVVPNSSVRMAGLRPAVLAADSGDAKVAARAPNIGHTSVPLLLAVPSARHAVSWWVGANGDGGSGAGNKVIGAGSGSCTSRMTWLLKSLMYRVPLTVSSATPQG